MITIEQLEKEQIHGNAHFDLHLLLKCHVILMTSYPVEEKIRALQLINKVTGIEEKATKIDVEKYIEFFGKTKKPY